jgi:hypothetical protein
MYRNTKLLEKCRDLPCQLCGAEDGTVVAAHSNQLRDGKGRGFKCHSQIDQGKDLNRVMRVELWELAHRKTIGELFERGLIKC